MATKENETLRKLAKGLQGVCDEAAEERLSERLIEVSEVRKLVRSIDDVLSTAESVENERDLDANLDTAIVEARELLKELCRVRNHED